MAIFNKFDNAKPVDPVRARATPPGHLPASSYPQTNTNPPPVSGGMENYLTMLGQRYNVGGSSTWERPGQ